MRNVSGTRATGASAVSAGQNVRREGISRVRQASTPGRGATQRITSSARPNERQNLIAGAASLPGVASKYGRAWKPRSEATTLDGKRWTVVL